MSVYVDDLFVMEAKEAQANRTGARHGHRWCHMIADSPEELHAFAKRLGLKRQWFQSDNAGGHYDLVPPRRQRALQLGAIEVSRHQLIEVRRRNRAALRGAA